MMVAVAGYRRELRTSRSELERLLRDCAETKAELVACCERYRSDVAILLRWSLLRTLENRRVDLERSYTSTVTLDDGLRGMSSLDADDVHRAGRFVREVEDARARLEAELDLVVDLPMLPASLEDDATELEVEAHEGRLEVLWQQLLEVRRELQVATDRLERKRERYRVNRQEPTLDTAQSDTLSMYATVRRHFILPAADSGDESSGTPSWMGRQLLVFGMALVLAALIGLYFMSRTAG